MAPASSKLSDGSWNWAGNSRAVCAQPANCHCCLGVLPPINITESCICPRPKETLFFMPSSQALEKTTKGTLIGGWTPSTAPLFTTLSLTNIFRIVPPPSPVSAIAAPDTQSPPQMTGQEWAVYDRSWAGGPARQLPPSAKRGYTRYR